MSVLTRRAALSSLAAIAMLASGCSTRGAGRSPAYAGPTRTICGYLKGPPDAALSASSVVFVTAYDATGGAAQPLPKIGATSFRLNHNGSFPVAYEIEIPASQAVPRISLAVEIRQAGRVIYYNDRQYSQTSGRMLDIPVREAPPRGKRLGL
ncbi:MAG: hypothetical protein ACRECY_11900 [Phyllobacterium sp.]